MWLSFDGHGSGSQLPKRRTESRKAGKGPFVIKDKGGSLQLGLDISPIYIIIISVIELDFNPR